MKALETQHPVIDLCAAFGVSRSGYHAWKSRPPSGRADTDVQLSQRLCQAHDESRQTYGSPRLLQALQKQGLRTSRRRVCRLMRQHELRGAAPRAFRPQTTDSRHDQPIAPNLMATALRSGSVTSPMCEPTSAGSTWRRSWIGGAGGSWDWP